MAIRMKLRIEKINSVIQLKGNLSPSFFTLRPSFFILRSSLLIFHFSLLIELRFPQRIHNQPHLIGGVFLAVRGESATQQGGVQFGVAFYPSL